MATEGRLVPQNQFHNIRAASKKPITELMQAYREARDSLSGAYRDQKLNMMPSLWHKSRLKLAQILIAVLGMELQSQAQFLPMHIQWIDGQMEYLDNTLSTQILPTLSSNASLAKQFVDDMKSLQAVHQQIVQLMQQLVLVNNAGTTIDANPAQSVNNQEPVVPQQPQINNQTNVSTAPRNAQANNNVGPVSSHVPPTQAGPAVNNVRESKLSDSENLSQKPTQSQRTTLARPAPKIMRIVPEDAPASTRAKNLKYAGWGLALLGTGCGVAGGLAAKVAISASARAGTALAKEAILLAKREALQYGVAAGISGATTVGSWIGSGVCFWKARQEDNRLLLAAPVVSDRSPLAGDDDSEEEKGLDPGDGGSPQRENGAGASA